MEGILRNEHMRTGHMQVPGLWRSAGQCKNCSPEPQSLKGRAGRASAEPRRQFLKICDALDPKYRAEDRYPMTLPVTLHSSVVFAGPDDGPVMHLPMLMTEHELEWWSLLPGTVISWPSSLVYMQYTIAMLADAHQPSIPPRSSMMQQAHCGMLPHIAAQHTCSLQVRHSEGAYCVHSGRQCQGVCAEADSSSRRATAGPGCCSCSGCCCCCCWYGLWKCARREATGCPGH